MPQYWFIVLCMANMGYSKTASLFTLCGQSLTTHRDGLHDGVVPKTFWSIDWLPGWGGCVPARGHLQLPHRVPGVCWGGWGFRKGDQQVLQGSILYLGTSKKVISHLCIFSVFRWKYCLFTWVKGLLSHSMWSGHLTTSSSMNQKWLFCLYFCILQLEEDSSSNDAADCEHQDTIPSAFPRGAVDWPDQPVRFTSTFTFFFIKHRHLCEHNDDIYHQKMAENEGIQIKEILAKADGGCPRSEDFEAAYNGYVFGPDGRVKERPYVYMSEKLRSATFNHLHWSVSLHMSHQRTRSRACKITLGAFVWLFSTVRFQMCPQIACMGGCILTLVALVWLFSTVCFQMLSQIACPRRCIVALGAFLWLFSIVHFQMSFQFERMYFVPRPLCIVLCPKGCFKLNLWDLLFLTNQTAYFPFPRTGYTWGSFRPTVCIALVLKFWANHDNFSCLRYFLQDARNPLASEARCETTKSVVVFTKLVVPVEWL